MGTVIVYLLVATATMFWGANFVLAGPVLGDMPPLWAAATRFLLGALMMLVIAGVRGDALFRLLRQHFLVYLMLGVVGIAAFNLLFFSALQSTTANSAALIMAINPLLTALLAAMFLGESTTLRHKLALPIAMAGVLVVISHGDWKQLEALRFSHGDLLMLAATLSWAMYNVLTRRFMPQGSPLAHTSWIMTAGALALLVFALGSGSPMHGVGVRAAGAMAVMVVGGTVLAYLFWGMGIARLGAGRAAIFMNLVPVFAMLTGALAGVLPTAAQLAGGALVLGGVLLTALPGRSRA